ncbi:MAG: MoxR family ATPase, partial [Ilumatobacteraceae bacterium]
IEIVMSRIPGVAAAMAERVVDAVNRLRDMDLAKPPGVAETIDWAQALQVVGADSLDEQQVLDTIGAVVKDRDDLEVVGDMIGHVSGGA